MDESVIPQNCINSKDKNIFVPGKQTLALMVTLAAFPAIAEDVTGNYQSYFQDESDTNRTNVSPVNKGNEQLSRLALHLLRLLQVKSLNSLRRQSP